MTFALLFIISLTAWLIDAILQLFLYYTSTPIGLEYMAYPGTMFGLGIYYSAAFICGLSLPSFIAASFLRKRPAQPEGFGWKTRETLIYMIHVFIMFVFVCCNHADHELLRFYGTHYSIQMMSDYDLGSSTAGFVLETLYADIRGHYSAIVLLLFPFSWLAACLIFRKKLQKLAERIKSAISSNIEKIVFFVVLATLIIFPITAFGAFIKNDAKFGWTIHASRRQLRVAPLPVQLIHDIRESRLHVIDAAVKYENIDQKIQTVRDRWLAEEPDKNWQFTGDLPLHKTYTGTCPAPMGSGQPNVVLIFMESTRAWNLPDFNDNIKEDPMPFLHSLIAGDSELLKKNNMKSAYFTHYVTNGQPTIDATIAAHIGLPPHSSMTVASKFTLLPLPSYASTLRKHGYHTTFVNSSDGGFDSWSQWTHKWYDKTFDPLTDDDNVTLKLLSDAVIERRKIGTPYMVSGLTITNHIPFDVPKGAAGGPPENTPLRQKMPYTLKYQDDALKAMFERLDEAGALSNTLFILVADHAYDLGEIPANEKGDAGSDCMRATMNWIPMIMLSDFDAMPTGKQTTPASHTDITPTILEAAGICDDNSYYGHSLMKPAPHASLGCKDGHYIYRSAEYAGIFNYGAKPLIFDINDVRQEHDLSDDKPEIVEALKNEGDIVRTVIDYGYEKDKFDHIN